MPTFFDEWSSSRFLENLHAAEVQYGYLDMHEDGSLQTRLFASLLYSPWLHFQKRCLLIPLNKKSWFEVFNTSSSHGMILYLFLKCPTTTHCDAVKRVLWFLARNIIHDLFCSGSLPFTFHACSDVDWSRDRDDYSSMDACIYLGKQPIFRSFKRQKGGARS